MKMLEKLLYCLEEEEIELLINKVYMVANYENDNLNEYMNLIEILVKEREKRKSTQNNSKIK